MYPSMYNQGEIRYTPHPINTQPITNPFYTSQPNTVYNTVSKYYNNIPASADTDLVTRPNASGLTTQPTATKYQLSHNWNGLSLAEKANIVVGAVGTLLNAYNGYKAGKLAQAQFNHAKQVAEQNWQAQRKMTNSQLEDRQKRRVLEAHANGLNTTSVADYMAKYGV